MKDSWLITSIILMITSVVLLVILVTRKSGSTREGMCTCAGPGVKKLKHINYDCLEGGLSRVTPLPLGKPQLPASFGIGVV